MQNQFVTVAARSAAMLAAAALIVACGGSSPSTGSDAEASSGVEVDAGTDSDEAEALLLDRMATIDDAVAQWMDADSIEAASVAAETVANLTVGPNGPEYGDRNGDGTVDGETDVGVLSGLDGSPVGLAQPLADNECIVRDVLGGTWEDPAAEWDKMSVAIDNWRPDNNTMPTLDSHPMRSVGWATFTLQSDSLDKAHEYAGHAQLHVDVTVDAIDC